MSDEALRYPVGRFEPPETISQKQVADWIDEIEALPRNPSGKILKSELRKPYWEGKERMVN